jgi:peroxiredoxin Q/BCP
MDYKINVGDKTPPFNTQDASGHPFSNQSLKGAPYILYFYPKDDTPGCTKEACSLRDAKQDFDSLGVTILGVSPDDASSHDQFKRKYGLNFSLLSDVGHKMCEAFDVRHSKQMYGKSYMGVLRTTFIVDGNGIIRWIERPVQVEGHSERLLEALKELKLA